LANAFTGEELRKQVLDSFEDEVSYATLIRKIKSGGKIGGHERDQKQRRKNCSKERKT